MREILDVILEEKLDLDRKKLLFVQGGELVEKLETEIIPGQVYEGSFLLQLSEKKHVYGYVTSSDPRIECVTKRFSGAEEIHFCFHAENFEPDEVCRGEFLICSNQGEFRLPYEFRSAAEEIISSQGTIHNLLQFANLARTDWQEALTVFYAESFAELIQKKEPQLYLCYQGLSAVKRNEHNMDQFLIIAGKKQRMNYYVEDSLLTLDDPEKTTEISVGIVRSGWGYTYLEIEPDGDFLYTEKEVITDDDFLGNRYKLSVYVDSQKLHAGRNYGRLILRDQERSVEVPIEISCSGEQIADREIRREKKKNSLKLTQVYQSFRLKEMNTADWLRETDQLVQRMMTLDENDGAAKLFFAHILITAERYNEAGWILEHFREFGEEMDPRLESYHLYLSSLHRRDEAYTKQVSAKMERIYKEQGENWQTAWLLLYVSKEYERSITGKWLFLEEQFEHGCRSPILYFEAVQVLNRNPALLRKIERFELQVLHYGNKKGILSPELLEQVYYLSGRVKEFSLLLYRLLESCYEKTKDERIIREICTLLIKGNRVDKRYYRWFKLGIEAGVKITNLYEYYMMSLDLEKEEELPKIVLMYFTYQSNLDYAHAAYLYRYVAEHQEEYPEIYESYVPRIQGFVKEQLQKARMNEDLDRLYHLFLTEDMLHQQNASAMVNVLFACRMQVPDRQIKRAYVYQRGSLVPYTFSVCEKTAWIPVFSKESCVVWEDIRGNRYAAGAMIGVERNLSSHPIVERASAYVEENSFFDLYLNETEEITYEADKCLLERLIRLWSNDNLCMQTRREVAVRIMKYYYNCQDKTNLSSYLERLSPQLLTRKEAAEAIKYMVYCRLDDLAYRWMERFSPVLVDSKISASLLSSIIKKTDYAGKEKLLKLAFAVFERGKYTNEILQYLAMHYEGRSHDQYQIWKAALACGMDIRSLSERILVQMLFTDEYVKEHSEVFKKYLKADPDPKIIQAYVISRSYAYYLRNIALDSSLSEYILHCFSEGITFPVICELACLKYYAQIARPENDKIDKLIGGLLKKQLKNGIRLPWFADFGNRNVDLAPLSGKTILEYHASKDSIVKFRFRPIEAEDFSTSWKIINMYPVCRRVFFVEQILFFGESLQYEIMEETDAGEVVVQSGILKKNDYNDGLSNRFLAINEILEAAALNDDVHMEKLLENYLKKEYINCSLFRLM